VTIPALTNIGGLLVLFLYIYSVLGVFVFAEVKLQSYLDIHANFQSFGLAFLTLLRCSTGEAWDSIMMDMVR
jgi:Ion transport protein